MLAKIFTNLEKHNLLIQPSKMALLTQNSFTFLGLKFLRVNGMLQVTMPDKKIKALLDFEPPKSILEAHKLIGFISFFAILLENSKVLLEPILRLIRKGTKFQWGEYEQKCLDLIKEKLTASVLEGYCRLTDSNTFYECHIYVDWSKLASCASAVVYIKSYKDQTLKLAMFWSRLLSATFSKRAPYICEAAAIALFLVSNKALLGGRCLNIYCDNLVACYLLRKGVGNVDSFSDGVTHRLLLSIANIPAKFVYTPTSNNPSDYLSRYSGDRADEADELCLESTSVSDLTLMDSKTFKPQETLDSYLENSKKNVEKMKQLASTHWDINLVKKRFKNTHIFSDNVHHNDDVIAICQNKEVPDVLNVESPSDVMATDIKTWIQPDTSDHTFTLIEKPYVNVCADLFQKEHTDTQYENFFKSSNGGDLIDFLVRESKLNPYTEKFMKELRDDSHFIASNRMLSAHTFNSQEGIIDNELYSDRVHLSLTLQEMFVISDTNKQKGIDLDAAPIFSSIKEIKDSVAKYELSAQAKSRFSYFSEIQNRSLDISLMKDYLQGMANEERMELRKKGSALFRFMFNNKDAIFEENGLLFLIKIPKSGEHHSFALLMEKVDGERQMIKIHAKSHRKYLYVYAVFSKRFFCINALSLAISVCNKCTQCAQMEYRKKLKCERINYTGRDSVICCDHKGPCYDKGGKPGYILAITELKFKLCNFTFVKTTSATETAEAIFSNYFVNYGANCTIVTDRSTAFVNELSKCLYKLGSISHRVVSAYHPQASLAESISVRPFSKSLRSVMFGRDASEIKRNVKYCQFIVNNLTIHELGKTPFELLTGSTNSFYHPILELKDQTLDYPSFLKKRIEFLQQITDFYLNKYDLYLSQKRPCNHTVSSLGLEVGQKVWVRIFKYGKNLKYLKSILPKAKLAEITHINGATSLILRDEETGRVISRHLSDVFLVEFTGNFSNLYKDSLTSQKEEYLEIEESPIIDSRGADLILLENQKRLNRSSPSQIQAEAISPDGAKTISPDGAKTISPDGVTKKRASAIGGAVSNGAGSMIPIIGETEQNSPLADNAAENTRLGGKNKSKTPSDGAKHEIDLPNSKLRSRKDSQRKSRIVTSSSSDKESSDEEIRDHGSRMKLRPRRHINYKV